MFDLERAKKEGCLTLDGRKVRILCDNRVGDKFSIIALVEEDGREQCETFLPDGRYTAHSRNHRNDLKNLPMQRTWFVVSDGRLCETEAGAIAKVREQRLAGRPAGYAPVTVLLTY